MFHKNQMSIINTLIPRIAFTLHRITWRYRNLIGLSWTYKVFRKTEPKLCYFNPPKDEM